MASSNSPDDSIELVEIISNKDDIINVNNIPPVPLARKSKRFYKTQTSPDDSSSQISETIFTKQNEEEEKLKPVPAPRNLKLTLKNLKQVTINPKDIFEHGEKSPDTADTLSGDGQSLFSLKSDTLSYREKLRNRFLSVKKQAEISIREKQKIKSKSEKKKRTSFTNDISLQNEERIIISELNKHRLKHDSQNNEAYEFFNQVFENDEEGSQESKDSSKTKLAITEASEQSIVDDTSSKHSLTDFLGINLDTDIVENFTPTIVDLAKDEKELFWIPKRKIKISQNEDETKSLEEDGLYVTNNNHIPKRELEALREKCLRDENSKWFGLDNQLNILPDPRLDKSFKPIECHSFKNSLLANYTPLIYQEFMCRDIDMYNNTLEIIINDIYFKHHPLYGTEHILAEKVISLCNEYNKISEQNSYAICSKKLEAYRRAKYQLEKKVTSAGNITDSELAQLEKYKTDIKETRETLYDIGLKEKNLKKSLLHYWKALKSVRATQKYSSTNIKLIIHKQYNNYEQETKSWQKHISQTVLETLDELEDNFQLLLKIYKNDLKEWKLKKRQLNDNEDAVDVLPEKPKKPKQNVTEENIKSQVMDMCIKCLKPPGEPNLNFRFNYDNEITETTENAKENSRRKDFNNTKIFLKFFYNNRDICTSKCVPLNNNFTCNFDEHVSLKIVKIPHSLRIHIYEKTSLFLKRLLGAISVEIPDINRAIQDFSIQKNSFTNNNVIKYSHAGAGDGMSLNDIVKSYDLEFENEDIPLFCCGTISYALGWNKENDDRNSLPTEIVSNTVLNTGNVDTSNLDNLEEWLKSNPDPENPQNAIILEYIKGHTDKSNENGDNVLAELEFCEMNEIDNNPRFKLLELRYRNEPEYKDVIVPNRTREITPEIFTPYEKRMKDEDVTLSLNNSDEDIDERRKWANKYLDQAENKIIQLSKIAEQKLTLKDVLDEESGPTIGSLGYSFINWLQPKRPLRPTRKPLKQKPIVVDSKEIKVIVNIVGATQVPVRKDIDMISAPKTDQVSIVNVRPFVVVTLRDMSVKTVVAEGPNPIWNQELVLPLRNKNENFSNGSLQALRDVLIFNLYDETVEDLIEDDRLRDTNIHQLLGCNWLGSLEIPLSTLLYTNKVEGTFQLNLPPVLIGYERQKRYSHTSAESFIQKTDTFLTLFAILQPAPRNLDRHLNDDLQCMESENVEEHITQWQVQFNTQYPHRQFTSLVTSISGEKCCATRYIKPLKAPYFNSDMLEITEDECARYVSLIPFRENSGLISDVWLSAEQLLTLALGSVRDHAVLLTCYFLGIGVEAWLLVGYGMLQGYTAYVLTKEQNDSEISHYIYDLSTARKYNIYDNICPLQKVYCVINDKNIWANIQSEERLHMTKFDFRKPADWRNLFNNEINEPASIFEDINITYITSSAALFLQERIEKKLRKKIMKWRKHNRTIWNHYCNATLKRILPKIEENYTSFLNNSEHLKELQNLFNSYQMYGFAICLPYTTMKNIVDFVQIRGIHLNENPNVEFSLSVYVRPYFNNVVIWIYLTTLLRRR